MKKILDVVSYSYLPFSSGGQKLVAQFFGFLGKETKLTVLSTCSNDYKLVKNYKLLPWLGKSFFRYIDIRLTWKIASLIKKERFEVIIWEHPYYAWLAWIIKKKDRNKNNFSHTQYRTSTFPLSW